MIKLPFTLRGLLLYRNNPKLDFYKLIFSQVSDDCVINTSYFLSCWENRVTTRYATSSRPLLKEYANNSMSIIFRQDGTHIRRTGADWYSPSKIVLPLPVENAHLLSGFGLMTSYFSQYQFRLLGCIMIYVVQLAFELY